jgi:hypothetical protein
MAKVTIESLAQRIAELESRPRSLNEAYQLEAYRELLEYRWRELDAIKVMIDVGNGVDPTLLRCEFNHHHPEK